MTIKERLYKDYVVVQNAVNKLTGKELIGEGIEDYFNSYDFQFDAKRYTKDELRDMIRYAEMAYDDEVEKMRVERYFNTDEGKAEKEEILSQIAQTKDLNNKCLSETTEKIDAFVKDWLGEDWGIGYLGNSSFEIGILDKKDDTRRFVFGHSFNVYFNDYFDREKFEMNYGCMGSFSLLDDSGMLRCKYLSGMGSFASNKEKLAELWLVLKDFRQTTMNYDRVLNDLKNRLHHPFDKKSVA